MKREKRESEGGRRTDRWLDDESGRQGVSAPESGRQRLPRKKRPPTSPAPSLRIGRVAPTSRATRRRHMSSRSRAADDTAPSHRRRRRRSLNDHSTEAPSIRRQGVAQSSPSHDLSARSRSLSAENRSYRRFIVRGRSSSQQFATIGRRSRLHAEAPRKNAFHMSDMGDCGYVYVCVYICVQSGVNPNRQTTVTRTRALRRSYVWHRYAIY